MGKQYGIPGIVPDTKGDGRIDDPQEVYDFLSDLPEDSKLKALLQQLAPQASTPAKIEVTNIKALTNDQCESLLSGDVVNKVDSTGKHSYRVSFKNATGMCLTYSDCENVETVAYNKSGDTWAYDSTDITNIAGKASVVMVNEQSEYLKNFSAIMGLAADPNAAITTSTTNPEWKIAFTDSEDRILLGMRQDYSWYQAADLKDILDAIIDGYGS